MKYLKMVVGVSALAAVAATAVVIFVPVSVPVWTLLVGVAAVSATVFIIGTVVVATNATNEQAVQEAEALQQEQAAATNVQEQIAAANIKRMEAEAAAQYGEMLAMLQVLEQDLRGMEAEKNTTEQARLQTEIDRQREAVKAAFAPDASQHETTSTIPAYK